MCFVSAPKTPPQADPNLASDVAAQDEMRRRRQAKGFGASLLTNTSSLGQPSLGRQTIAGA